MTVLCRSKSGILLITTISLHFLVVTPFLTGSRLSSRLIQQPPTKIPGYNNLAAVKTTTTDTVIAASKERSESPKQQTPIEKEIDCKREKLLDEALYSNSTAANLLLNEISKFRSDGKQAELDSFLNQLLYLVDEGIEDEGLSNGRNKLPWWTKIRFMGKLSRRARRASLRRVLNFSTPSSSEENENEVDIDEATAQNKRNRRRALVIVLRSLAEMSSGEEESVDNDDDTSSTTTTQKKRKKEGIAILNVERAAQKDMKNTATYKDMDSRIPAGLETPKYTVVMRKKGYEIRNYDAFSVCSVPMAKPRPSNKSKTDEPISNPQLSGASSFGALAGYLFGKNEQSTSMKMTTPVLVTGEGNEKEMSFVLPSTYWDESGLGKAPKPFNDSLVSLRRDTGGNRAVMMFGGVAKKSDVKAKNTELLKFLGSNKEWDVEEKASITLAQYNDPFTLPWKRRNEVSVAVVRKGM